MAGVQQCSSRRSETVETGEKNPGETTAILSRTEQNLQTFIIRWIPDSDKENCKFVRTGGINFLGQFSYEETAFACYEYSEVGGLRTLKS